MKSLRRNLRRAVYLPLVPVLKVLTSGLRRVGWLSGPGVSSAQAPSILVAIPYNSLGDMALSVPLLEGVHGLWPEASIDVVVGDKLADFVRAIPFVGKVISYAPTSSDPPIARYQAAARLLGLAHRGELAAAYDIGIDPRWDSDGYGYISRALLYVSGAKKRIGYSGRVDGNDLSLDAFLTDAAVGGVGEHEILRKLRLLQRVGLTQYNFDEEVVLQTSPIMIQLAHEHADAGRSLLQEAGISLQERYVVLAPGATKGKCLWPIREMALAASLLHEKYDLRFVIVGGPGDAAYAAQLAALQPEIMRSVAGKTDVVELLSLLWRAELFIGNDSGPAHLSGILGTPTIVTSPFPVSCTMEHVNAPSRFRPCGPRVRVLQPQHPLAPCDPACAMKEAHCICQIGAAEVFSASRELLDLTKESR
jgi:ADP-heptose:LPS heptosyltransferase